MNSSYYFKNMQLSEESVEMAYMILFEVFSSNIEDDLMQEKGCFRTEIRDTKEFICGVHISSGTWPDSKNNCPEIVQNVSFIESRVHDRLQQLG